MPPKAAQRTKGKHSATNRDNNSNNNNKNINAALNDIPNESPPVYSGSTSTSQVNSKGGIPSTTDKPLVHVLPTTPITSQESQDTVHDPSADTPMPSSTSAPTQSCAAELKLELEEEEEKCIASSDAIAKQTSSEDVAAAKSNIPYSIEVASMDTQEEPTTSIAMEKRKVCFSLPNPNAAGTKSQKAANIAKVPLLSASADSAVSRFQHALLPTARVTRSPAGSISSTQDSSSQYAPTPTAASAETRCTAKNPRSSKTIRKAGSPPQPFHEEHCLGIDDVARLVTPPPSIREARPALSDEPLNPFHYNSDVSQTLFQRVKRTIIGSFTFPFRTFHFLSCLVMAYVMSHITILGVSREFRLKFPIQRNFLREFIYFFVRIGMTALGYYTVTRIHPENYGRLPDGSKAPHLAPIIVTNHCTLQDVFFLLGEHGAAFVGKREITQLPFIYGIGLAQQVVEVDRDDHDSRGAVVCEMTRRAQWTEDDYAKHGAWRPSVVFPEGTCTNCSALIQFKAGAFTSGAPVQPVLLRYPYKYYDQSWCGVESPVHIFIGMLSQFYNRMEVEYLPMYIPSEEEKRDANLYAENVRQVMAKSLGIPTTEHNYFDVKLNVLAYKIGLPMDRVNVECGSPHFNAIKYPRMQHQLEVFASLLYVRSDSSKRYTKRVPPEGITSYRHSLWKRHRTWRSLVHANQQQIAKVGHSTTPGTTHLSSPLLRRYDYLMNTAFVEEGFMSAHELEDVLSLQRYPSLLVCVLTHLSRHEPSVQLSASHVANRGIAVSFRSFLSAFTTEEVSYLDALPARDAAAAVVQRVSDALAVEREIGGENGKDVRSGSGSGSNSMSTLLTAGQNHGTASPHHSGSSKHTGGTSSRGEESPNFKDTKEIGTPTWLAPFVHTFRAEDVTIASTCTHESSKGFLSRFTASPLSAASSTSTRTIETSSTAQEQQLVVLARRTLLMLAAAAAKCHLDRLHADSDNDNNNTEDVDKDKVKEADSRKPFAALEKQDDVNRYVSVWNACNHALDDVFAGYRTFRNGLSMAGEYDYVVDEDKFPNSTSSPQKSGEVTSTTLASKNNNNNNNNTSSDEIFGDVTATDASHLGMSRDDFTTVLCPELFFPKPTSLENEGLKSALKKRNTDHMELSSVEKELHGAYHALFDAMVDSAASINAKENTATSDNDSSDDDSSDSDNSSNVASTVDSAAAVISSPVNRRGTNGKKEKLKDILLCSDVDAFVPFAFTHRGLLLYLYATCEHYLMGDDLS